ncbi:MAG: endolytic transglycosylase MltG [Lachnospiraceae bacterium]|nr:endolytic transglycosylase MltG [Lachnospiraceae bacterium]MBR0093153.1 endolytic transglycosylase MltG [Lachnospiraceae bacterium]
MKKESAVFRIIGLVIRAAFIIIAIFLVIRISRTAYEYGYETFAQKPLTQGNGRIVTITVGENDTVSDVAKLLEEKGLVKDALLFRMQEMFSDYNDMIAPGVYDLSTDMTADEMLEIMAASTLEKEAQQELQQQDGNSAIGGATDDPGSPADNEPEEGELPPAGGEAPAEGTEAPAGGEAPPEGGGN